MSVNDGMAEFGVSVTSRGGSQAFRGGIFIAELCELGCFSFAYDMRLPDSPHEKPVNVQW